MVSEAVEVRRLAIAGELIGRAIARVRGDRAFPAWVGAVLAGDRRFGSRDRRFYRELIFTAVRFLPWIESLPTVSRALASLWLSADPAATGEARRCLLQDAPPAAGAMDARAAGFAAAFPEARAQVAALVPEWTRDECPELIEPAAMTAINTRAPVWLRARDADAAAAVGALAIETVQVVADPRIPGAVRVVSGPDVTRTRAFAEGLFEVQDIGSQWVLQTAAPAPGERWLDACAGSGGKTLQLAGLVGSQTPVVAHDIRTRALDELRRRARRARVGSISVVEQINGAFDAVLVDAPCSGSGTWRRNPHLKWQTSRVDLRHAAARQQALLQTFAEHVRTGGRLVYATCSLAALENAGTVRAFLARDRRFVAETPGDRAEGATLLPQTLDSDGFFVSVMRRTAG